MFLNSARHGYLSGVSQDEKLAALEAELASKDATIAETREHCDKLSTRIVELQKDCDSLMATIAELWKRGAGDQEMIMAKCDEVKRGAATIAKLQAKITWLQQELAQWKNKAGNFTADVDVYPAQVVDKLADVGAWEKDHPGWNEGELK